ncbi:DUF2946 family protein [Uliginosibacterium sp. sgz301328]|uniref:DUF2946 family protein n=1 Tax=Uliginosibacterium sp. sgz301328 TaxID=3243764 RepID=UPI00359D66D9
MHHRNRLRFFWAACLAMLVQVLLPVAHASMPIRMEMLQGDICSVDRAGTRGDMPTHDDAHAPKCPLCTGVSHAPALPTQTASVLSAQEPPEPKPAGTQATAPAEAWSLFAARAPPSL